MKNVYIVWRMTERGAAADAFILNVYKNKNDALEEAKEGWTYCLERTMRLEGAENIIYEADERFNEEIGTWRFRIITSACIITYKVERREVR